MLNRKSVRNRFLNRYEANVEPLESRLLLAVDAWGTLGLDRAALAAQLSSGLTTTASEAVAKAVGQRWNYEGDTAQQQTADSGPLINLDDFQSDPRFTGVDGSGYAAVVLDTGIDLDHPFFGPDATLDGVADRIVYNQDFTGADSNAQDVNGHGSNVSSIVASQDATYPGVAPGVDIIHLQVLDDAGFGNFGDVEAALQWVVANAATYNIVTVNMSLSDGSNRQVEAGDYGLDDELAALAALDVVVVSAAGNSFYSNASVPGVSYPAADPNSLAVSAVWDGNNGGPFQWGTGAIDYTTDADRLTSFSQRHPLLTDVLAPGALITGADAVGGVATYAGTSQAAPHIAGVAVLAQQLADAAMGRRLTNQEFADLLQDTAVVVNDGDDENDNVINTGADYFRVDMFALAEAIEALGKIHVVSSSPAEDGLVTTAPLQFVFDFSTDYSDASVQAADLTVNGVPADLVELTDDDTLTFTFLSSPVTTQGMQSMQIAAGAIEDESFEAIDQYDAVFRWDAVPMQVLSSTPTANSTATLPLTNIRLDLNEAYDVASLGVDDLALSRGSVVGFNMVDADTVEYTIAGLSAEGSLTARLVEGALQDVYGNPSQEFTSVYTLDFDTVQLNDFAPATDSLGTLQREQLQEGSIQTSSDIDTFTVSLESQQSLTVFVDSEGSLRSRIRVFNPQGVLQFTAQAPGPGALAYIQSFDISKGGVYSIQISSLSGSTGSYSLAVIVSGDVELEEIGVGSNDTIGTAQNLNNSLVELDPNVSRTLIQGAVEGDVMMVGPDAFGYEALVVPFEFDDISDTGTKIFDNDVVGVDNATYQLSALHLDGFTFSFYGSVYTSAFISSNGSLNFFAPDTSPNNSDLTQSPFLPTIAVLWDDLFIDTTAESAVYWEVQGSGSNQQLVVQWNEVRFLGAGSGDTVTFQAVLSESDNTIQLNYLDLDTAHPGSGGSSATVGIKDLNFQIPGQSDNRLLVSLDDGPNEFVDSGVSLKIGVGIVPEPEPDYYSVTLAAGDYVSVVATSERRGTLSVELRDHMDMVLQSATSAVNADAVIDGYSIVTGGTYYVRVTGATATDYRMLVTRNASFDIEANDEVDTAQDITATGVAFGSVGYGTSGSAAAGTPVVGPYDVLASPISLGFAADGSFVGSTLGARHNGVEYLDFGTALAAYTVAFDGATYTNGSPATGTDFAVTLEDISSGSEHGVRIQGTIVPGVVFERIVRWSDGDDYAVVTTSVTNNTGGTLNNVALLENQDPDPGGDVITSNDVVDDGNLVLAGSLFNGVLGLGSIDPRAVVSVEGNLVTDPFDVINSPQDPYGQTADLSINLAFDLGAILPGVRREATFLMVMGPSIDAVRQTFSQASHDSLPASDDYYSITLADNETILVTTRTPGETTGQGTNGLNPAIEIFGPGGGLVAADAGSAADGKNALLSYTTSGAGVYTIRVLPEGDTQGDYVLVVNRAPTVSIDGPATAVPYQPRTFTLTATDSNPTDQAGEFHYRIDWDLDGTVDQTIIGPSTVEVTHRFSDLGVNDFTVSAIDARNADGPDSLGSLVLSQFELQADDNSPGITNLAVGGSKGVDQIQLFELGAETVSLNLVFLNGVFLNTTDVFGGIDGRVMVYTGPEDDAVAGTLLTNIELEADGGAGDDILVGGSAVNVLVGGDGDDTLLGGSGNDILWADSVDGAEGATGNDLVIGGAGDDFIAGDGSEGGDDFIYGFDGNDTILAGGGDDYVEGGNHDDRIYGGDGAEGSSDQLFGGGGNDFIDGGVGTDTIDGGAGRDFLVGGVQGSEQVLGDWLLGESGEDIFLAGALLFDEEEVPQAVDAIMAEWTSGRDYATRIENISGTGVGPRDNGDYFLQVDQTVEGNSLVDDLTGGSNLDWFLYTLAEDILNDPEGGETELNLPSP